MLTVRPLTRSQTGRSVFLLATLYGLVVGCSGEPDWPEPTAGLSTEAADYEDSYADSPFVQVPAIEFEALNGATVPLDLPSEVPANSPLGFEGKLIFPEDHDHGDGIWVKVFFIPERRERRSARMTARAEGPNGQYAFRFSERTPVTPGRYRVEFAAFYMIPTDDPADEDGYEFTTVPVATGQIVLTPPTGES